MLSGYVLGSSITNSLLIVSIVSSLIYICSIIPLLVNYGNFKQIYCIPTSGESVKNKKTYKLFNLYHIQFGIFQTIIDVVIPLYLFINNLTFQSITIIIALVEVCKMGAYVIAKHFEKKNLSVLSIIISIFIAIISLFLMLFTKNVIVLYITSCCLGISFPLLFSPMFALFVNKVKQGDNQYDGMTYRDIYIFSFRNVIYLPYFVMPNFIVQFILGIVCSCSLGLTSAKLIKQNKDELLLTKEENK